MHDVCGGGGGQRTNVRGSADETGNAFAVAHNLVHIDKSCTVKSMLK